MTQGVKGTFAIRYISVSDLADWYSLTSIYRLIHQLDFSWITSRSKHPKRSQAAQEDFKKIKILKKFKTETINTIPGHIALNKVDIWFQDEAGFCQQNTTTRLWAQTSSRPRCVRQQPFESAGRPTPTCLALFVRQPGQQRPLLPRVLI
jgi:hypothetical protein